MNIRKGLFRISALLWSLVAALGILLTLGIASDFFRAGNMGKTVEVVLLGFAMALTLGYGGHKAVCWVIAGFSDDGARQ